MHHQNRGDALNASVRAKRFYLSVDGRRELMPFPSLKQAVASIASRDLSLHHKYQVLDQDGIGVFRFGISLADDT